MEPVPGLRRLGLMAFRWVSIVSAVVCVGAIALPAAMMPGQATDRLAIICLQTARCVSVMELCLLAFLALSIHALGRSFRSRLFGIGLGFGVAGGRRSGLHGVVGTVSRPDLDSSAGIAGRDIASPRNLVGVLPRARAGGRAEDGGAASAVDAGAVELAGQGAGAAISSRRWRERRRASSCRTSKAWWIACWPRTLWLSLTKEPSPSEEPRPSRGFLFWVGWRRRRLGTGGRHEKGRTLGSPA